MPRIKYGRVDVKSRSVRPGRVSGALCTILVLLLVQSSSFGQQAQQPAYLRRGEVRHANGSATVVANDPRPLSQAITAVREEYGWRVSYEDPPYQSSQEVYDASPPAWHTTHPGRTGFLLPAGHAFQSTYAEAPNIWSSSVAGQQVLEKIIFDYNQSGNPGNFIIRQLSDGSLDVIGSSVLSTNGQRAPIVPILDTQISLTTSTRDAYTTIDLILSAVSANSGTVVALSWAPLNVLHQSEITVGGNSVVARSVLLQALAGTKRNFVWDLYYFPSLGRYQLRLLPVELAKYDMFGNRPLIPIEPISPQVGVQ